MSDANIRLIVKMYTGFNGQDWVASGVTLYDSGGVSGMASGAFSGSSVDVNGSVLGLVEITVDKVSGSTLKQIVHSLALARTPF